MPILRDGQWSDDTWLAVGDEDAIPADGAVIVSLKRFQDEKGALLARKAPLSVKLKSDERAHAIGADAQSLAMIIVEIPMFKDGRAFSAARLLRERYGYTGEIRASGHILPDQVLFLARCGVNSFDIKPERRLEPYLEAFREYSIAYQNPRSSRGTAPALRLRSPAFGFSQAAE